MFEQTKRLAEKLAASVSRRGFLGSLGGWAAAAAMGVAGLLTGTQLAQADNPKNQSGMCCQYRCSPPGGSFTTFFPGATACPSCGGGTLIDGFFLNNCRACSGAVSCKGCPPHPCA
jgi:hypothetical protein